MIVLKIEIGSDDFNYMKEKKSKNSKFPKRVSGKR
jgi:hypothetical protein